MPVVGILFGGSPAADRFRLAAIQAGLNAEGFLEGQNVTFEYRWAENQYDRLPELAADLVGRRVAVLVAVGNTTALAAKAATSTIPVVFETGIDPVEYRLVASLARPGANVTGVTFLAASLIGKQFELLHETVPKAAAIGLLENPTNSNAETIRNAARAAADALGTKLVLVQAVVETEFDAAFGRLAEQQVEALLIRSDILFNDRPQQLAALAARHALPAIHSLRDFAVAGGLMSYGENLSEFFRRAASFVDKVFKGARPGDLPIEQPTRFNLVINRKTADTLGVTIPPQLYIFADEVIE